MDDARIGIVIAWSGPPRFSNRQIALFAAFDEPVGLLDVI